MTLNSMNELANGSRVKASVLPASLHFVPGGSLPTSDPKHQYLLNYQGKDKDGNSLLPGKQQELENQVREQLILLARSADSDLKQIITNHASTSAAKETNSKNSKNSLCHFPSLSVLAEAVFNEFTGAAPNKTKTWADAMVLAYFELDNSFASNVSDGGNLVSVLKELADKTTGKLPTRPCGYVFKRGDMAWNCRTCQTDSTCVLCDSCFQASDHIGHEVSFHQSSPGGCCDCGDIEAWAIGGCCPKHRPIIDEDDADMAQCTPCPVKSSLPSYMEAVLASNKSRAKGEDAARNIPLALRASLAIVIGAAVHAIVEAVDGTAIGSDLSQWRYRWAEQFCKIQGGCANEHDFLARLHSPNGFRNNDVRFSLNPLSILTADDSISLTKGYSLHLRLHNDDVHTFDEVIDALHPPSRSRLENNAESTPKEVFIPDRNEAEYMTQLVDSEGQVLVKTYNNFQAAEAGFLQLKNQGLHCSVVSNVQLIAEDRAKSLLSWLCEISTAHPGVSALVCHALVDVLAGDQVFADVNVWPESRQIPCWAGTTDPMKRYIAFPPEKNSSYLTRKRAKDLYQFCMRYDSRSFMKQSGSLVFKL